MHSPLAPKLLHPQRWRVASFRHCWWTWAIPSPRAFFYYRKGTRKGAQLEETRTLKKQRRRTKDGEKTEDQKGDGKTDKGETTKEGENGEQRTRGPTRVEGRTKKEKIQDKKAKNQKIRKHARVKLLNMGHSPSPLGSLTHRGGDRPPFGSVGGACAFPPRP